MQSPESHLEGVLQSLVCCFLGHYGESLLGKQVVVRQSSGSLLLGQLPGSCQAVVKLLLKCHKSVRLQSLLE